MTKHLIRFDWAMKKLLRSPANFSILEGFLSELLNQDVKILQLLESESNKNHDNDKNNKVDILVQLQNGEIVLIEVQTNSQADYFQRMLYGSSRIVTDYLGEGSAYAKVKKVYSINILYFDLGHGEDYIYHGTTKFVGIHKHDQLHLNEKQQELYKKETIHQLYPEYYLLKVNQFNDIAKNTLDEWIYFLKNEEIKDGFKAKGLEEARNKLSALKLPAEEKLAYKKYLENLHYQESMVTSNFDSGWLEGKKAGVEEGEKIGVEKGRKETVIDMAKKLLAQVILNTSQIAQLTGLSVSEIEKLKKSVVK